MRIALAVAGLVAVALCGCHRKEASPKASAPLPEPLSFSQVTPDSTVKMTLAPVIAQEPGLRFRLYGDGVKELKSFAAQAHGDRAHLAAKGLQTPPYQRDIAWTLTAATPRLLSARESWFDDTGGAHPNHGWNGLLWNIPEDRAIPRAELFRPDADQAKLEQGLCEAIKAAKVQRVGAQEAAEEAGSWPCPRWADSDFVFAPSTVHGKLGGLVFLFDPYSLGPYAEGDYQVTVPLAEFQGALSPAYADEFAGAPEPLPPPPLPER